MIFSRNSRKTIGLVIEFACFSFYVGLLFINFRLSNRTLKITRILTLYQANTPLDAVQ